MGGSGNLGVCRLTGVWLSRDVACGGLELSSVDAHSHNAVRADAYPRRGEPEWGTQPPTGLLAAVEAGLGLSADFEDARSRVIDYDSYLGRRCASRNFLDEVMTSSPNCALAPMTSAPASDRRRRRRARRAACHRRRPWPAARAGDCSQTRSRHR